MSFKVRTFSSCSCGANPVLDARGHQLGGGSVLGTKAWGRAHNSNPKKHWWTEGSAKCQTTYIAVVLKLRSLSKQTFHQLTQTAWYARTQFLVFSVLRSRVEKRWNELPRALFHHRGRCRGGNRLDDSTPPRALTLVLGEKIDRTPRQSDFIGSRAVQRRTGDAFRHLVPSKIRHAASVGDDRRSDGKGGGHRRGFADGW